MGSYLGFQAELPIYLAEYGFSRKHDIENFFNLINSAAENFPKYVDYERERVQNGYGRADFVYVGSIEQCENFTGVDIRGGETQNTETENFLIPLFKSKIANCSFLTEEEKAAYNDRIAPAVNDVLIPAYVKLGQGVTEFIGNENNNQKGLAHYENGKNIMSFCSGTLRAFPTASKPRFKNPHGLQRKYLRIQSHSFQNTIGIRPFVGRNFRQARRSYGVRPRKLDD